MVGNYTIPPLNARSLAVSNGKEVKNGAGHSLQGGDTLATSTGDRIKIRTSGHERLVDERIWKGKAGTRMMLFVDQRQDVVLAEGTTVVYHRGKDVFVGLNTFEVLHYFKDRSGLELFERTVGVEYPLQIKEARYIRDSNVGNAVMCENCGYRHARYSIAWRGREQRICWFCAEPWAKASRGGGRNGPCRIVAALPIQADEVAIAAMVDGTV